LQLKGDIGQDITEIKSPRKIKPKKKKKIDSPNRAESPVRPRQMSLDVKDDYNNYSDNEVDRKRYGIKHGLQSKSTTMLPR
jgi:hypothetical protein